MDKRRPAVREEEEEPPGQRLTPVPPAFPESALQPMCRPRYQPKRPTWATVSAAVPFRRLHFPSVATEQWGDWRWQLAHRITRAEELKRFLLLSADELAALSLAGGRLPVAITPYYLSLVHPTDPADPVRRTVVPTTAELASGPGEAADPLHEDGDSPVPGLVHRYPDRVLVLATPVCSTYCRYCTRSRRVGDRADGVPLDLAAVAAYIAAHPEIRDVILSGGDPLALADEALESILAALRRIPHVQILRIGTKVPMVLPSRITTGLVRMLRRYHPVYVSLHATHPRELTRESFGACVRLADAGIPVGSQTVLLAGVNDTVETMTELAHRLLAARVRPYYLYQCDPILGSAHFRTPVARGLEIIRGMRGFTSGYAVPTYVIDAPGGGGKIPLLPDYRVARTEEALILRNYAGREYRYQDAAAPEEVTAAATAGVSEVLS